MPALISTLAPGSACKDADEFLARLVATAATIVRPQQAFALLCTRVTGEPDLESLQTQSAKLPALSAVLRKYVHPEGAVAQSGDARVDPHLWMIPVIHDSRLEGLLGVLCQRQADEAAVANLQTLRLLSRISGPVLAALRDLQRLQRTVDELEAVLQINSHLMSNVCHEFRSALAAVRGYAKRVIEERAGPVNQAQHDDLAVVLKNTNKLLDLVTHSLPFVAEQHLRVESVDVRETWQGALERMRHRLGEKSITVTEQISSEPFTVTADRQRLVAVCEIILANAIQCAAHGGEITAQLLRGGSGEVTVRVLAAGEGLAPQVLDRIFNHPDGSVPALSDPDGRQVAGLSLVHDMVWLHGGRIAVVSSPREGTVFLVTLPPPRPGTEKSRAT